MVLPDPEDRYGAGMPQQLLVRSARSLFRPKLISCPPFAHALMPWTFAIDSPVETSGTGWQHSAEAPLCPARGSQSGPKLTCIPSAEKRAIERLKRVSRLCGYKMAVDGSRWQFLGRVPSRPPALLN